MQSNTMKYLIFRVKGSRLCSVVFHQNISHRQAAMAHSIRGDIILVSAGFCYIKDGRWHTYGRSDSLDKDGLPDDYLVLNKDFFEPIDF